MEIIKVLASVGGNFFLGMAGFYIFMEGYKIVKNNKNNK